MSEKPMITCMMYPRAATAWLFATAGLAAWGAWEAFGWFCLAVSAIYLAAGILGGFGVEEIDDADEGLHAAPGDSAGSRCKERGQVMRHIPLRGKHRWEYEHAAREVVGEDGTLYRRTGCTSWSPVRAVYREVGDRTDPTGHPMCTGPLCMMADTGRHLIVMGKAPEPCTDGTESV